MYPVAASLPVSLSVDGGATGWRKRGVCGPVRTLPHARRVTTWRSGVAFTVNAGYQILSSSTPSHQISDTFDTTMLKTIKTRE